MGYEVCNICPVDTGQEPVLAGSGGAGTNERFASSRAAALLDGLFSHPAGHCHTDTAHELIVAYCAVIEFFAAC